MGDVGLRAIAPTRSDLYSEVLPGLFSILFGDMDHEPHHHPRPTDGVWRIERPKGLAKERWTEERRFHAFLDRVLFEVEVEERLVVRALLAPHDDDVMRLAVTMIPVPIDALSIHIKAVSHHGLSIHHLTEGQHMPPTDETPEIIGPAWVADVVFDL